MNYEVDQMPAGRELDLLVETEIFGSIALTDDEWNLCMAMIEHRDPCFSPPDTRMLKMPLSEPSHQMKLGFRLIWPRWFSRESIGNQVSALIDKMRADGWLFDLTDFETTEDEIIQIVGFQKNTIRQEASGESDAHAICLAALKAVRALKALEDKHEVV
jgi:hypothetical protein